MSNLLVKNGRLHTHGGGGGGNCLQQGRTWDLDKEKWYNNFYEFFLSKQISQI